MTVYKDILNKIQDRGIFLVLDFWLLFLKKNQYIIWLFTSCVYRSLQFWMVFVLVNMVCLTSHQHRKSTGCTVTPLISGFAFFLVKHFLMQSSFDRANPAKMSYEFDPPPSPLCHTPHAEWKRQENALVGISFD